ncbi:hypothetical protein TVAG_371660 [Trichomonas vaginalis G3]|uniref:Uncharacterized protein n=1 Tax=Trichomonas vaginalis (strain ATCC PRA-98 / G3) TaxID=412133 RepID=A2E0T7_TRIV3|nr:armadillo (ARM) repeat-containing protein family [Trichomonas vaginalis G3]EAY13692.1 hypothetical protein TVAG_371660 [Trichomonas vaginalis G3]KAI5529602.1 armadillo (ARM) repeat-containing protein family [Trichomonas vaginalis G3]|eukprot:XP_001325915.1 hypothetical protein [Trichomonas vaginalis G3]
MDSVRFISRSLCCVQSLEILNQFVEGDEFLEHMLNTTDPKVQALAGSIFIKLMKFFYDKYRQPVYNFIITHEINDLTLKTISTCAMSLSKIIKRSDLSPTEFFTDELFTQVNILLECSKNCAVISALNLARRLIEKRADINKFNYKQIFYLMCAQNPTVKQKAINASFIMSSVCCVSFSEDSINKILLILANTINESSFKETAKAITFLLQMYLYSHQKVFNLAVDLFEKLVEILNNECSCVVQILSLIIKMTEYSEENNYTEQILELFSDYNLDNALNEFINGNDDGKRYHAQRIRDFIDKNTNQD